MLDVNGDTANCRRIVDGSELDLNIIYQSAVDFDYADLPDKIKLPNMGYTKPYRIEWYNALTDEWLALIHGGSTTFGNLELDYPDTLTGDFTSPILFFKIYPADDTFLASVESGAEATALPDSFKRDDDALSLEKTHWVNNDSLETDQFQVTASPNPTTNNVLISISGQIPFGKSWYPTDAKGIIQFYQNEILLSEHKIKFEQLFI